MYAFCFQVDYLRTSKLETLEGSIGRIQVSAYMLYVASVLQQFFIFPASLTKSVSLESPVDYYVFAAWCFTVIVLNYIHLLLL